METNYRSVISPSFVCKKNYTQTEKHTIQKYNTKNTEFVTWIWNICILHPFLPLKHVELDPHSTLCQTYTLLPPISLALSLLRTSIPFCTHFMWRYIKLAGDVLFAATTQHVPRSTRQHTYAQLTPSLSPPNSKTPIGERSWALCKCP